MLLQKQREVQKAKDIKWKTEGALKLQHFATGRMTKDWHRLSRDFTKSFKSRVDTVLGNQVWVTLLEQGNWIR